MATEQERRALASAANLGFRWYSATGGPLGALPAQDLAHIAANDPQTVLRDLDLIEPALAFVEMALCNAPDVPIPWGDPTVQALVRAATKRRESQA